MGGKQPKGTSDDKTENIIVSEEEAKDLNEVNKTTKATLKPEEQDV